MNLLRIDSSPMGEAAISRRLTTEYVKLWRGANPNGAVVTRALTSTAIPVVTANWVAAQYTPEESRTPQQLELLKLSTELIAELRQADEYVIGMPMHNWGPPSCFKLWVDHIVTPSSSAEKPLSGKRITFVIAAGRVYTPDSPDASRNYLIPWLCSVFEFLGGMDMNFIFAQGTRKISTGKIDAASFLAPHVEKIRELLYEAAHAA